MIVILASLLLLAPQSASQFTRTAEPDRNAEEMERQSKDRRGWNDTGKPSGPPAPVFLKTPTVEDLVAAYPPAASASNLAGEAVLRCKVDKTGHLADCKVSGEAPARSGFGEAALALSKVFVLDTKASDGSSMVGRSLSIPLKFKPTS